MGKTRPKDDPYMVWSGPFGPTKVLKAYSGDDTKPYARWFVAVNGDMGDSYVADVVGWGQLLYVDPKLTEQGYVPPKAADLKLPDPGAAFDY